MTKETPSYYADQDPDGNYDCSLYIGPLGSDAPWPMFSYDRPAYTFWNGVARGLYLRGWSDEEIKAWLQSKEPRRLLDEGSVTSVLKAVGNMVASNAKKVNVNG